MSTAAKDVTLSLGLVSTKVRLEPITEGSAREATQFKEGHDCGNDKYTPLTRKRVCPECDVEVDYEDVLKLRPVDGGFVPFNKDEVNELKESALVSRPKVIDLTPHDAHEVELATQPNGKTYYVYSGLGGNDQALATITEFVRESRDTALVSITSLRKGTEYMCRLTMVNGCLALQMLMWPDEVAQPKADNNESDPKMLAVFEKIVDGLKQPFDVSAYKNSFKGLLAETERARVPGEGGFNVASMPAKAKKGTPNLLEAMEQYAKSLEKPKRKRAARAG